MGLVRSGSYGHRIRKEREDEYVVSWRYDMKYSGVRGRFPQTRSRDTNRKGAERFSKKWSIPLPE